MEGFGGHTRPDEKLKLNTLDPLQLSYGNCLG
jgi:hypothetical protein